MAHYAFLDENNVVVNVITGKDEFEDGIDWEKHYGDFHKMVCKRTSYNTVGGKHPDNAPFRKNYAGVGYTYDPQRDAFIPPKPFPSWKLIEESCLWEPPIPYPEGNEICVWDEATISWKPIQAQTIEGT